MILNMVRRLFMGRYGFDQLSMALLVVGTVFMLAGIGFGQPLLYLPYYLCMGLILCRAFSRNTYKRWQENGRYLNARSRVLSAVRLRVRMLRELRTHRYLKCPCCSQRLRVPRGRGRISITCAKCHMKFVKKV